MLSREEGNRTNLIFGLEIHTLFAAISFSFWSFRLLLTHDFISSSESLSPNVFTLLKHSSKDWNDVFFLFEVSDFYWPFTES